MRFKLVVYEEGWARVELLEGTLTPDLKACMNDVLQMLRFPPGPASAEVTYAVELLPTAR